MHVYSLQFPEATSHQWSNYPWFDNRVLSATITCGSLEENGHFKHFLEIADNKDTPISRRTIFWKMHTSVSKEGKRNCYDEVRGPIICVNNNVLCYDRRLHSMSASNPWSPLHLSPSCWTVGTLRTNIEGSESLLPVRRSQKNMVFARRSVTPSQPMESIWNAPSNFTYHESTLMTVRSSLLLWSLLAVSCKWRHEAG